ncbi:MAG: tyrosine--tRNA ligase [Bacillota bacterium]|uniref:Tyrosine--tRNA ligase n=1 Tax=Thermanaerosceptrum fracticalcis TaxID=1712410 RepID=A0A7G6E7C6_THEFR|nr:tyrosine--tRNA ligase [Thermanaerosceptrum fracticalcis]QNB47980.1 tyrosine--tRNA ligase [Thermanaerosceptrum fracticalcis]
MANVYDILRERGYIEQATHEEEIRELLEKETVTFYIGFDPTADSLHVGHFIQVMVMMHMQRAGHRPIAIIGGGTAMVGDPSGKTDMRKMLTRELIEENAQSFKKQFSRFIDFGPGKALMVNNADWLMNLNYIEFLRDIGKHFSVNRMLSAECFKNRLERGLSFLEFNYMLMQAYDFLELYKRYNCKLQMGGNDQWSNIIAGVELIRRAEGGSAYGLTFKLLTTSEGKKMGKTESGAIWLDPAKTSPYDFYQYWRNVDDRDVKNCLALLTFLPMEEVNRLGSLQDAEINRAKEVLAYEVTKLVHGEEEAEKAQKAARALFGSGGDAASIPCTEIPQARFTGGMDILTLLMETGLAPSKSEGRRLIQQGGLTVNENKIDDFNLVINLDDFADGKLMLRKGKKVYHQVKLV